MAFQGSTQSTELGVCPSAETQAQREANGAEGRHGNHQAQKRPKTQVEPAELLMVTAKVRHHMSPMEGARCPGVA